MDGSATHDLAVVGYLLALPFVTYALIDLARIPGHLYRFTTYSRTLWVGALLAGYAAFGVGGIIVFVAWLRSTERDDLRAEWALDRRWERDRESTPITAPATLRLVTVPSSPEPERAPMPTSEPLPDPTPLPEPPAIPEPAPLPQTDSSVPSSRRVRRLERKRRHRWAIVAVTLPLALAVVATAARVH